ncbi:DUF2325 domain-containing protein [Schinkia azotoformans]|uniref:DUF2325 domain-containing protein n=1 Tax=Schinkia azotoformans TaxID=1454 RepID=UPI002DB664CB|nr:DUF2325 domain-containing protein [Schinkia azotoformans]MEC1716488.1 DUF2325 domain-containing protein [Schinkia azotoformans]MEC1756240.1 DUF2325 domain-containing protein [Schinkia azotoformans]
MKKTICIIGGTQQLTINKLGVKKGFNILFHDGRVRGGGNKSTFLKLVQQSNCVIVLSGACSHESMWLIKDLCKRYNVPIHFQPGRGISGAINQAALLCS